jgi:hypothetical protein
VRIYFLSPKPLPWAHPALGGRGGSHPPHDAYGFSRQEARVANLVVDDAVEYLLLIVPRERGLGTETARVNEVPLWATPPPSAPLLGLASTRR